VGLNPIAAAPDAQMRELVDDFLAAQRSPGTRASYASDLAIFLGASIRFGRPGPTSTATATGWRRRSVRMAAGH
jgi:hypothetical protein